MSSVVDIRCEKPLRSKIRPANARFALEMVADPVLFFTDLATPLVDVNRAACRQLGFSRQQLQRRSLVDIVPHPQRQRLANRIDRMVRGTSRYARIQTVFRRQDGMPLPVRCSVRALARRSASLLVAVAHVVKDCRYAIDSRFDSAFNDSLTGLPNRAWILDQLEQDAERARHSNYRFAVLFVDVDRFKTVNDSFGHLAGDRVLQAVACRLTSSVRPGDAVARYGGDEFVVLIRDVRGNRSINRIARRIGRPLTTDGMRFDAKPWRVPVTISVGVAIDGGRGSTALFMIDRADRAMYRAKSLGRNGRLVVGQLSSFIGDDQS